MSINSEPSSPLSDVLKDRTRAHLRKRATWSAYYRGGSSDREGGRIMDEQESVLAHALSPYFHLGQAVEALWDFHMETERALIDAPGRYSPTLKNLEPSQDETDYRDFNWLYGRVSDETEAWVKAWRDMARNLPRDTERPWKASVHWYGAELLASAAEAFIGDCLSSALLAIGLGEADSDDPYQSYWIGRNSSGIRTAFSAHDLADSEYLGGSPKAYGGRSGAGHVFAPHQLRRRRRGELGLSVEPDAYSGWL